MVLPLLGSEEFCLRPFVARDVGSLQSALNDPQVTERLTNIPQPYTKEDALAWITSTTQCVTPRSKRVSYVIDVDGEVAGSVSFINLDLQQQNAQISVWVASKYWGRGLAVEALQLLLQFGFKELDLYRIFAFYVEDNVKSKGMLDKLGFEKEGIHREEWKKLVDGEWQRFDSVHCSLLKPDWEERMLS